MTFKLITPTGSTPIDPNEVDGLIPQFITTQEELNILEQENILNGKNWALKYNKDLLVEAFVRALHKKMYADVWSWAGQYRKSQKSIGIDANQISTQIFLLMQDVKTWIDLASYPWPEILARFHHRLVYIHPFPNGNGRFARLYAEVIANRHHQEIPTWGTKGNNGNIKTKSDLRLRYIESLRWADQKRIQPLVEFLYS